MSATNGDNGIKWEHMDKEAEQELVRIMDEDNRRHRGDLRALAADVEPAESSPVIRRDDEEADEGVVESRLDRVIENNDEEMGEEVKEEEEEEEEDERVGQSVREVSRGGGEIPLTDINVLGGDRATVGCLCRPDVAGATSETEWIAVDCCLYRRQRAERAQQATKRQEKRRLLDEANHAVAGPSRQPDGQECLRNKKKRTRKGEKQTNPKRQPKSEEHREEKKKKREKIKTTEEEESDIEVDFEAMVRELNDNEGSYGLNKDDPTVRELMGWSPSDEDSSSS